MKKFVILENVGTYEEKGNRMIVDCTVKETKVFAESNDWDTIFNARNELPTSEYRKDGTWHTYSIELRKYARKMLK